jgi:hypothetical protein
MSGPAATAMAPAEATRPYGRGRSAWRKFDATKATTAGMISAAPTPSVWIPVTLVPTSFATGCDGRS